MGVRYRLDPAVSRFTVQAFAGGLLSFLGHNPTFRVRDFRGDLWSATGMIPDAQLEVTVRANGLQLADAVAPGDRVEIERRMRDEVLRTDHYPEVTFRGATVSAESLEVGRHRLHIGGQLSLHGVTRELRMEAGLTVYEDGIRLAGAFSLRPSDYGIEPVTALGGTIKLRDELRFAFDLGGRKEQGA